MILDKSIQIKFADRINRVVAPVIFLSMAMAIMALFLFGDRQYQRLIPALLTMITIVPAWFLTKKGRPLTGVLFVYAAIFVGVLTGMTVSGGIRAPAYVATFCFTPVFVVLYGARGGAAYFTAVILLGGLFVQLEAQSFLPQVAEPPTGYLLLLYAIFFAMQIFFILIPVRLLFQSLAENQNREQSLVKANILLKDEVAERAKIESMLRNSEQTYRQLVESGNDAILIAQDEKIKFHNQKTVELLRYDPEEIKVIPFIEFIHPEDRELVASNHLKRLKGDPDLLSHYTFRIVRKDKSEAIVQLGSVLIEWDGKPATLNFIRDITDQKKMEAIVQQAQKIEAIGTLAGGIAHDFNNLLMGIQGRTSLITSKLDHADPIAEHIKAIEEYIQSATNLTRQLLGTARGGKYDPKPLNLNDLVKSSSLMFGRTRKEIIITTRLSKKPVVAEVDKQQIEQVLLNMYVNAWQAMPGGGKLHLKTTRENLEPFSYETSQAPPGIYAKISITDFGTGMNEATRQRIFDPFFTTKEMERGADLGLASAYGIIKNHDGFITVHSEIGYGTTFNIYLPWSSEQPSDDLPEETEMVKGWGTILLVDDEQMIVDVGHAMLSELGYKVIIAKSGDEAMKIVKNTVEQVDLVILDMIMPGMDGGKAFDQIRQTCPSLPVILSTGYTIDGQAADIMRRGCDGFIQKPFNLAKLSQKIRSVLRQAAI